MVEEQEILNRWRLVLGKYAAEQILFSEGDGGEKLKVMEMEDVLDYLYSREYGEEQEIRQDRRGGSGDSQLTIQYQLFCIYVIVFQISADCLFHINISY